MNSLLHSRMHWGEHWEAAGAPEGTLRSCDSALEHGVWLWEASRVTRKPLEHTGELWEHWRISWSALGGSWRLLDCAEEQLGH